MYVFSAHLTDGKIELQSRGCSAGPKHQGWDIDSDPRSPVGCSPVFPPQLLPHICQGSRELSRQGT